MSSCDELVSEIAGRIERYLTQRPEAADTAEGISKWWLSSPLGADALPAVLAALLQLEARGVVVRTEREGLATIFSSSLRGRGSVH